ncbi:transmembrane emp24 domain-containing protein 2-like [Chelonus insularis]|uniref:transmembrane emp24 domain-containing protein 2-like n=1 Tax=Chelonus insularis TaxID=460826 RepID=UPI00158D5368|nr:transmembrane emp24 domain-containing protein 2-like [Chelonus insularis]
MKLINGLLIITCLIYNTHAYFITVDAHTEECFYERVEKDTKMGLTFEIAEGGFLDIDLKIVGPDGKVIHNGEREGGGKYTFAAYAPGVYTYCFSNQKSTLTSKVVMFNMEVSEPSKATDEHNTEGDDGVNHRKLDDMISDLSKSLSGVKNEQEYMQVRDRNHRAINESTNFRVVLWSIFEASVLVSMTFGQIFYLKRFFEVRRVV